jgi:hypothetical protein
MRRREEHERKARERVAVQFALDCEVCGALTPASRFRYFGDRLICEACEHQNPQTRVRSVSRDWLMPRTVLVNFIPGDGVDIQAMHMDHRTMLGPHVRVQRSETFTVIRTTRNSVPSNTTPSRLPDTALPADDRWKYQSFHMDRILK